MEQPISEYELIKLTKKNLRDSIGRMIYPIPVSSLKQLRIECIEAERNFARSEGRYETSNKIRRSLNEIELDLCPDPVFEINEVNKEMKCWNCKKAGHGFIECPSEQRAIFCYKCGKPEVITPKFPHCNARSNHKWGVIATGDPRPAKQTPKF